MNLKRIFKHLVIGHFAVRRAFPPRALRAIEQAIRDCEAAHRGQIRFAVESALDIAALSRGVSARARAIEVFSQLRVWDTEHNNGVLIYLLLADRNVEIVADRGVHARLGNSGWEEICRTMEQAFRERRFEEGVIAGIKAVGGHLQRHYPSQPPPPNELPDKPVIL
ncbi:MAG TPA: TPM domain-containing protein [Burkholderiales bacterium]|nr:TPM domain-containing protein [Burkholderiales bacterium]